jgi:succinate dehydrogenase/fumarate reductase-like Fe-S protein
MNRDGHNEVSFFIGTEVEHTPAFGKRTLFVVGVQDAQIVIQEAKNNKIEHIYFGANQSFPAIDKNDADASFAAAMCIGCGACVAACKNSSAMLFLSAKVSHLALLPQGDPERQSRVVNMVAQMDKEGFGACTNTGACEATCPKEISLSNIARLNQEYLMASLTSN